MASHHESEPRTKPAQRPRRRPLEHLPAEGGATWGSGTAGPDVSPLQLSPGAVLRLHGEAGNRAVTGWLQRSPAAPGTSGAGIVVQRGGPGDGETAPSTERYPWIGRIRGTTSAALRSSPKKDPSNPHGNTVADLPEDTWVDVIGRRRGWLQVRATVKGREVEGYVSQELVAFNRYDFDPLSLREALVVLKRAEVAKRADSSWTPDASQKEKLGESLKLVGSNTKYFVDPATYSVTFAATGGPKIKISTIEDFVLFVEAVEAQYPGVSAKEVVSEIRQLWFSDVNWEVLVGSEGISAGGKHVDIETAPNPIAERFDMADLAPNAKGKTFTTEMGDVNIGHVLSGIDARLSGSPAEYPEKFLKALGHDSPLARFKYETLREFSDKDPTAFATFAGDLGQAYAVFIYNRYDKRDKSAKLWQYLREFAKPEELVGDLHGYIAASVAEEVRGAGASPTGGQVTASSIVRDMYLVDKSATGTTYLDHLEKVSGKKGSELENYIYSSSMSFAHPWYAKVVADDVTELWPPADLFEEYVRDFSGKADRHENSADRDDTLKGAVEDLMTKALRQLR